MGAYIAVQRKLSLELERRRLHAADTSTKKIAIKPKISDNNVFFLKAFLVTVITVRL